MVNDTLAAIVRPAVNLDTIAARIKDEFRAAEGAQQEALQGYRTVGRLLIEAKAGLKHGEWLPWLKANVPFSERHARRYMDLAKSDVTSDLAEQWATIQGNRPAGKDAETESEGPVFGVEQVEPEDEKPEDEDDGPGVGGGNLIDNLERALEGEEPDDEGPDNYDAAFLIRVDTAMKCAQHAGPVSRKHVSHARRVAELWSKLADKLEASL